MITILSNLKIFISGVGFNSFGKSYQYQCPTNHFVRFGVCSQAPFVFFLQFVCCEFCEIPNQVWFTTSGLHYEVYMITNNNISK